MGNCQYLLSGSNASIWPSFSVQAQNGPKSSGVTVTKKVAVYFDGADRNVTYEVLMSLGSSNIQTQVKVTNNTIPSTLNINEINNEGLRFNTV